MPRSELSINNAVIRLLSADITERPVDAIVNAANTRLQHGGGVAGAILRAGGKIIQDESNRIGYVPVGGAALTSGGALSAGHVIHAVGPIMGEGDEDRKLRKAINSVLALASENHFTSISVPAISAGIFGFPKDRCARILIEETAAFAGAHPDSTLRLIEFCIPDQEAFRCFERELLNHRTPPRCK